MDLPSPPLHARVKRAAWWFRNRGPQGRTATHRSQWHFAAGDEHVAPAEPGETGGFTVFFRGFSGVPESVEATTFRTFGTWILMDFSKHLV